jgi:hypothetical protein
MRFLFVPPDTVGRRTHVARSDPDIPPYRPGLLRRLFAHWALWTDRWLSWWKLPTVPGLLVVLGLRELMRQDNLYDISGYRADGPDVPEASPRYATERSADGSHNDLREPRMGMTRSRFGRNMAPPPHYPDAATDVLSPSPREISRALLTRHEFRPATTINALSAAWLQFMVRDWFHHERGGFDNVWEIALGPGDDWRDRDILKIPRTPRDGTRPADSTDPPTFINVNSHWWDASQLYGNDAESQRRVRTFEDGKLTDPGDHVLPVSAGPDQPADDPGYWLGLAMLQILFVREHNAICDRLRAEYPHWTDEELFQRARLVNAALIAKIHVVEWTPALISLPTSVAGMRAIWHGVLGERVHRLFGRVSRNAALSGIPGSGTDHFGVPFAITEEFSAVYRMHPLIPDDWTFHAATDGAELERRTFRELTGLRAAEMLRTHSLADLFYSFGRERAGALRLHNFPRFMQEFLLPHGQVTDLAATDILRVREFGVPRYNEFRRRLRLRPRKDFVDLTRDEDLAAKISKVYGGDIEKVDLLVGLLAEELPRDFAFSDTTFRIFLLMASRRLNSDRFFTTHYNARVYTDAGLAWIDDNTMTTVLLRHLPQLRTALHAHPNPFKPFGQRV